MNDFTRLHTDLLHKLELGARVHLELSDQLLDDIEQRWAEALTEQNDQKLNAIMCVLDHARHPTGRFENLFFLTLEKPLQVQILIVTLACSWKHLIERWTRNGDRIPERYLNILRSFLGHQELEMREWTLRTIDQIGPQGRLLAKEIFACKKPLYGLINPHAKAINQMIGMFEKRWNI